MDLSGRCTALGPRARAVSLVPRAAASGATRATDGCTALHCTGVQHAGWHQDCIILIRIIACEAIVHTTAAGTYAVPCRTSNAAQQLLWPC